MRREDLVAAPPRAVTVNGHRVWSDQCQTHTKETDSHQESYVNAIYDL